MSICYLNGAYLPLDEARVSVLDRGFIFGDGIYEVIPVFGTRPFRLSAHLARLARSLEAVGIRNPLSPNAWQDLLENLVTRNAFAELSLYLQITRGVAQRNHAAPEACTPTVFAMASPLVVSRETQAVRAVALPDLRWQRCDIKAISLLPNVMARTAAVAAGAYEAILFRDGMLTEGAASNVFIVSGGRIRTPPHSGYILPGITRDTLIEALAGTADAIEERAISRADVLAADELWLTSSTRDLVPVSHLDEHRIGSGGIGAVFARVYDSYVRFKETELSAVAPISQGRAG